MTRFQKALKLYVAGMKHAFKSSGFGHRSDTHDCYMAEAMLLRKDKYNLRRLRRKFPSSTIR